MTPTALMDVHVPVSLQVLKVLSSILVAGTNWSPSSHVLLIRYPDSTNATTSAILTGAVVHCTQVCV